MDFHNMKRKRLQSLCKKHGIPANLKNAEMAERLSLIFKEMDKCGLDASVTEKETFQCNEDIIILDEEEETQLNELKPNNTDNHQMVDSDTASGDADLHHGKLKSSHKRCAVPSSEENYVPDSVMQGSTAVVIKYANPSLCDDNKCDDHIDHISTNDYVSEIEKRGFEAEQVNIMIHERSNSSKDGQNEVRSDSCNDSDDKRDQLLPATPQIEVKSGSLSVQQVVASDTSEAKDLSIQKTIPVADSEKCIGFSPELLEASVIKGMEPLAFFTPRISTCEMQHSVQSAKMEMVDDGNREVLHEEPNLIKISTEHLEDNLVEREDNNLGDYVSVHGDHCGAEVGMVSSGPSQLKLSRKRSPDEDLEDSNALSPKLPESSVIKGTETETKFIRRTADILETCNVEKIIQSVKMRKVDNSQEALRTSPNAVVVNDLNLGQDSSEEFSYSLLEGEVKKSNGKVDVFVIGKAGVGAEDENQIVTKSLERSHCAKDALEETSVTCGFSPVEAQSPNYKDMDEAPTQLPLSMPQIEVSPCDSNIQDMNSPDTRQVKLSEEKKPVADSDMVLVNRTDDIFGKSVTAGCSLSEFQLDSNNKDKKPYQFPPAMSQTEVDLCNRDIHEMVYSEDTCQLKSPSPEKTSPVADLEESCGISMLFEYSGDKTFGAKPNSVPKTPISFPRSCVAMEQIDNHEEVFHGTPDTLLQVSTEDFCQSTVGGDGTNFHDNGTENDGTENDGSESEKQVDMLVVESIYMAKDALGNSNMTLVYCPNGLQSYDSESCKDSDEPFMPEHASDAASGDANAYQEKSQSSQKKSSVKNSDENTGFSPKLLESSMIQGFEAASNLIARTPRPRDIHGTFEMKENMHSVKKQIGTMTSKKTSHKRQPLQDIQQNRTAVP